MTVCSEKGKLKKSENIDLLGTSKNVPAMQVGGVYHAKDFLDNNRFSQLYVRAYATDSCVRVTWGARGGRARAQSYKLLKFYKLFQKS